MKRLLFAACMAALGCEKSGHEAPPAASAAPSAVATTTAQATATATSATSTPPAAPATGGFSVVATGDDMTIYPLGDGAVLDLGAFTALLGDGPLVQDPEFTKTAPSETGPTSLTIASRFETYTGRAPGQMTARERGPLDFGDPWVFARVNGIWVKQSILRKGSQDRMVLTITAWDDGRAIAAVSMGQDMRFTLVNSKPGVIVPAPGKPTAEQGEECPVRMTNPYVRLAGLPSGHLFAAGIECKTNKAIAERWEPKKVRGEVTTVEGIDPDPDVKAWALAAASPDEAYALFGAPKKSWLATWDGKAWKAEAAPFTESLFLAGDGTVWGYGRAGLFRHPKGGAWTKLDLPSGQPTSAWAKDENNVWVVMDRRTLLHKGGPPGHAVELPSTSQVTSVLQRDSRWLATPFCKSVFAMLATLGPSGGKAPESYAPLTDALRGKADLLKGATYVVDDNGASLFVGAKAPSVEIGEKIIAAFQAKNPKATPVLYCHEPKVVGTLKVE